VRGREEPDPGAERTAPILPLRPGLPEKATHDYRQFIEARVASGTPETQVDDQVRAEIGFDETDVDRALARLLQLLTGQVVPPGA
jgi:hypothetical protein